MAWSAGHTLLLLLVLLLGMGAGWLLWGRSRASRSSATDAPTAKPLTGDGVAPAIPAVSATPLEAPPATEPIAVEPPASEVSVTGPTPIDPPVETAPVRSAPAGSPSVGSPSVESSAVDAPVIEPAEATHTEVTSGGAQPAEAPAPAVLDTSAPAVLDAPVPVAVEDEAPVPARLDPVVEEQPVVEPVADAEPVSAPEPVAEPEPMATPEPVDVPAPVVVPAQAAPVGEAVPEMVADDDLRRIEGIGPKMASALKAAGIRTYQQLGETDVATLRAAVRDAGLRAVASLPTWPQQARILAGGGEAAAVLAGPADGAEPRD